MVTRRVVADQDLFPARIVVLVTLDLVAHLPTYRGLLLPALNVVPHLLHFTTIMLFSSTGVASSWSPPFGQFPLRSGIYLVLSGF